METTSRTPGQTPAGGPDLRLNLETPLPATVPVDSGTAVVCLGTCFHRRRTIERLEIVVDGEGHRPTAWGMPRPDLFRALHPSLGFAAADSASGDPSSREDPEIRCYRSGFWATIPIEPRAGPGEIQVRAEVSLNDGGSADAVLGRIAVVEPEPSPRYDRLADRANLGLIAVCMATFDPEVALLRTQLDSLRAQTDTNWVCLISDDASDPDRFAAIEEAVGDDQRFVISRSERNLGFYRNFERALELVPAEAELVALCDQDDRWYPHKLEVLRRSLGDARLVYSDTRLVDTEGRVLRETMWERRRNNHTNFASMLIANTVPGAASLFRREVLEFALPFPDAPGDLFHDHWLALVAMATGELAYVGRPLYDYVQHSNAVQGRLVEQREAPPVRAGGWRGRLARAVSAYFAGWRSAYFLGYLPLAVQASVLRIRCSSRLTRRKRRALVRVEASGHSAPSLAWLAIRRLRALFGYNETLGAEGPLAKGILWRHVVALRVRGHETPSGRHHDASLPPPSSFDQKRLRRWRALR
ncbi:MAG: glycosyltransferase [Solirubrobacterales bacterium]